MGTWRLFKDLGDMGVLEVRGKEPVMRERLTKKSFGTLRGCVERSHGAVYTCP